jgi:hypothetical protein
VRFRSLATRKFPNYLKKLPWHTYGKNRMQELLEEQWGDLKTAIHALKQEEYIVTWPIGASDLSKMIIIPRNEAKRRSRRPKQSRSSTTEQITRATSLDSSTTT